MNNINKWLESERKKEKQQERLIVLVICSAIVLGCAFCMGVL